MHCVSLLTDWIPENIHGSVHRLSTPMGCLLVLIVEELAACGRTETGTDDCPETFLIHDAVVENCCLRLV